MSRRVLRTVFASLTVIGLCLSLGPAPRAATDTLPSALSDAEFWALSSEISEANGFFQSDNLTSNELNISAVAAQLAERVKPGGVYVGVGPEQNFTYIAAAQPRMAFLNDIRRGNLQMHLMYKAIFELSANRIEFVSLLLTKQRPSGLTASSSAAALMNAYWDAYTITDGTYEKNLQAILDVLVQKHKFPLSAEDIAGVTDRFHTFYWCGPAINYSVRAGGTNCSQSRASWGDLMMTLDGSGVEHSFLSSEETFATVKALHNKNLIVPTVGDVAGPKALRAIAAYMKSHDAVLSAFYISNVEQYLGARWQTFCGNVATMPLDDGSVFIRPMGAGSPAMVGRLGGASTNLHLFVVQRNGVTTITPVPPVTPVSPPAPPPNSSAPPAPVPARAVPLRSALSPIATEVAANNCGGR